MRLTRGVYAGLAVLIVVLAGAACEREQRQFGSPPPAAESVKTVTLSELHPGSPTQAPPLKNSYEESAFAISEGKRLYTWFNCGGCHFQGGGGIGPALMDEQWAYGSDPANIFATIVEGRPNGMPSFRGKIPDAQVWQIVAYVRSLSGLVPKDAASGRSDHMNAKKPEQSQTPQQPKGAGIPKPAEQSP
jgi:cytochrome c oxidase cbb3-type subunit III